MFKFSFKIYTTLSKYGECIEVEAKLEAGLEITTLRIIDEK